MDVILDVGWLTDADCRTIDALARLQLAARRGGRRLVLRGANLGLREVIEQCGMTSVLPWTDADASGVEPFGQAEEREPARGVEEERDPGDAVA